MFRVSKKHSGVTNCACISKISNDTQQALEDLRSLRMEVKKLKDHVRIADEQLSTYKSQRTHPQKGQRVLTFDWKENLKLGGSSVENSQVFRSQKPVALMGCMINDICAQPQYVHVLTYSVNKDSWNSIDCFERLLSEEWFWKDEINALDVWFDRGPHFSSFETLKYWLVDVPQKRSQIKKLSMAFCTAMFLEFCY